MSVYAFGMSLSDLASLGSFVSGVAVLASLVFLYFQMRQMTEQVRQTERNQRSLLNQQRTSVGMEAMFHSANPQIAPIIRDVRSNPRGVQPLQLLQYVQTQWALWTWLEDGFYQYETGLFDEAAFEPTLNAIKLNLAQMSVRAFWLSSRGAFSQRFVEFVDALLPTISIVQGDDGLMVEWHRALDQVERETKRTGISDGAR